MVLGGIGGSFAGKTPPLAITAVGGARRKAGTCRSRPASLARFREAGQRHGDLYRRSSTVQPRPSGLALLYEDLRAELLRFLVARVGDRAEAEDILQELWLRIRDMDDGPVANGRAYLYRAAQNLVLDSVRARQRRARRDSQWSASHYGDAGRGEPADPGLNAESSIVAREDAAALASAIAALPEAAGRAFRMHKIEGTPHAEIAARLGISRSGVEKHIAVAMAHLRRALKD